MTKKNYYIAIGLCVLIFFVHGQKRKNETQRIAAPITIKWVNSLPGDFSFTKNWSYPLGVERKSDGRAGCADGGFCPDRCYPMLDSNGIVLKDSTKIFYELLDTIRQFHSIKSQAWCYEWAGTDFIEVFQNNLDTVYCFTATGIATHCSLKLQLVKNICYATIDLNSIVRGGSEIFYCTDGFITVDKLLWKKGIMKAVFNFNFEHKKNPKEPMYWKGKIYSKTSKA